MTQIALEALPPGIKLLVETALGREDVVLTRGEQTIARIEPVAAEGAQRPRQLGFGKDLVLYMADDFNAPVEDFGDL